MSIIRCFYNRHLVVLFFYIHLSDFESISFYAGNGCSSFYQRQRNITCRKPFILHVLSDYIFSSRIEKSVRDFFMSYFTSIHDLLIAAL